MSRAVEVLDDLFFFERGYLSGNHFALRAPAPVLIDTAYASRRADTLAALEALGVDWRRTRLIVNTHAHCDHVGANRAIQDASGCEVAMHGFGRQIVAARDAWATWWDYYHQEAEFFDCTRELGDGETIALGPHAFEVLHTPGHSRDGLALYHRKERLLLSGDTLWESDLPVLTARIEGDDAAAAWAASLERLARLDVRLVYPGHGKPFTGFREALARSRARVLVYAERPEIAADDLLRRLTVYTLLMRGGVPTETFFDELMRTRWFPDTVARFFGGEHRRKYDEILRRLGERAVVRAEGPLLAANVPP